jgi:hypothetical protein
VIAKIRRVKRDAKADPDQKIRSVAQILTDNRALPMLKNFVTDE